MSVRITEYRTYTFTEEEIEGWINDYCEHTPVENFDEDYIKESLIETLECQGYCEIEPSVDNEEELYKVVQDIKMRLFPDRFNKAAKIQAQISELYEQINALNDQYNKLVDE